MGYGLHCLLKEWGKIALYDRLQRLVDPYRLSNSKVEATIEILTPIFIVGSSASNENDALKCG